MDGEQDGAQAQGEERTRQQGDPRAEDEQQRQKAPEQVGAPGDDEIRAALAERDEKIAEPEAQVAETSKSVEAANRLAADIEAMRKANEDERLGFELRLAGARNERFYAETSLSEQISTNLIYQAQPDIRGYGLYDESDVKAAAEIVFTEGSGKSQGNVQDKLVAALKPAVARRNDLDDDSRYQVHRKVRSFYIENTDFFTSLFEDGEKYRAMMNAIGQLLVEKFK